MNCFPKRLCHFIFLYKGIQCPRSKQLSRSNGTGCPRPRSWNHSANQNHYMIHISSKLYDQSQVHMLYSLLQSVRLFATPQTVVYQAPLSMGFSRQEYWSGVPFPYPGDLQKVLILQAHLVYFLFQSYNQSLSAGALLPFIEQQYLEPDWGTGYAHCYWASFTQSLIRLFAFVLLSCKSSIYILDINLYEICDIQIFSPILLVVFSLS